MTSDAAVIQATARVLHRVGPAHFTLATVAAEVGLSPSTLVQRFGSKKALFLAFAESAASEAAQPFVIARQQIASPLAALRRGLVQGTEALSSRQEVVNGLMVLIGDLTDEAFCAAAVRHAKNTRRAIQNLLDEAIQSRELENCNTQQLSLSIQSVWNGAIIQWALRGDGEFGDFLNTVLAPLLPDTME